MRPVRVTGVTGTSDWIPLDTYSPGKASVHLDGGTGAVEYTLDNPFETTPAPTPIALTLDAAGAAEVPAGARAVRGTGLIAGDVLSVSQQGVA